MADARESAAPAWAWHLLAAVALYLPFEDFLLKWLPVGEPFYSLARLLSEGLVYALLLAVLLGRLARDLPLARTPIDRPLLAFLALALASMLLSRAPLFNELIHLRALVRYVAVFYLVVLLRPGAREIERLLVALVAVAALEGALALLQHSADGPGAFWLPRASELEVGGFRKEFTVLTTGIERGAAIGTLGHSVALALFALVALVLGLALALSGVAAARRIAALALPLAGIALLYSYSRAALLAGALALVPLFWLLRREPAARGLLRAGALCAPLALAGVLLLGGSGEPRGFARAKESYVDPLENLEQLAAAELLGEARGSRAWVLFDVGREILAGAPPLGYGPDEERAKLAILESARVPLHRLIAYRAFEDVYWVALLAYYGLFGLAAFAWLLGTLFATARRVLARADDALSRGIAAAFAALWLVTIPLTFVVRTFEFRSFAFGFWLLAGLVALADARADVRRDSRARAG